MIALYHRASSADADPDGDLEALRRWREDWQDGEIVEFLDQVEQPRERWPAAEELARAIAEGEIEGVVTQSLHKLFRGPRHLRTLGRQMVDQNVWLYTIDGSFDGRFCDFSEVDRDELQAAVEILEQLEDGRQSERTRAGLAAARAKGRQLGGVRYQIAINRDEIKALFEGGKNGRFLSYREIILELRKSGGQISRGKLLSVIEEMREAGQLDDAKREHHRRQSGRRGGRKRMRVSYDPDEIRALLALGYGPVRIQRNAQSLPRKIREGKHLGVVRRIIREVKEEGS